MKVENPIVTISDIEVAELASQVATVSDTPTLKAAQNPVEAAESVMRGLLGRFVQNQSIDVPPCHTASPSAMGWSPDSHDCARCLDKLTCIVGLHRLGLERPVIRFGAKDWEPEPMADVSLRVPIAMSLIAAAVPEQDLNKLPIAVLRTRAKALGLVIPAVGMSKDAVVEAIKSAQEVRLSSGQKHAAPSPESLKPQQVGEQPAPTLQALSTLQNGQKLKCLLPGVTVSCTVAIVETKDSRAITWIVGGRHYKTALDALDAACSACSVPPITTRNPVRAYPLWGVQRDEPPKTVK